MLAVANIMNTPGSVATGRVRRPLGRSLSPIASPRFLPPLTLDALHRDGLSILRAVIIGDHNSVYVFTIPVRRHKSAISRRVAVHEC